MEEMAQTNPLLTEKVSKLLVKFAIPAVLSMLIDALYNIVDQIFIGQGVGYLGISATTVSFPFVTIILSIGTLLGIGGSVFTSISMGAGRNEDAEKTLGSVFSLAIIIGILLSAVCLFFIQPLIYAFGATNESQAYILDYATIILLGAPFSILTISLSSMARAEGNPLIAFYCLIFGATLNLILDPIYIFILDWGVKGAAIATVTSQILSSFILIVYFIKKGNIRLKLKNIFPLPMNCQKIFIFGLPACLIQISFTIMQIALNNSLVYYSTQTLSSEFALSTIGVVMRISSLVISICVGIGLGIQPIIGFNKGAGLNSRVKETFLKALLIATIISSLGWLLCELFPIHILRLFGLFSTSTSSQLDFAIMSMRIFLFGMFTAGLQVLCAQYYLAIGQAPKAMFLSILRPILLMLPILYILPIYYGLNGILYASALTDLLSAAIMAIIIRFELK